MMRRPAVLLPLAVLAIAVAAYADPPAGFRSLFNGRDLTGWRGQPHLSPYDEANWSDAERAAKRAGFAVDLLSHWRVDGDEIVNDGAGPYLTSGDVGDFELHLDYKTVAGADSGIYLRGCPQVQIWDTTEAGGKWNLGADKGSGALWNNERYERMPLVLADRPFGEWNGLRIRLVGARTTVYLNDQLVVDHVPLENYWDRARAIPRGGPIQLQTHGGEIRFRNLLLRDIGAAEGNAILDQHGDEGFEPVFNGHDLAGWAGPLDQYEVKDGAIVCKPGMGGTIYTAEEYGDFAVRLEIKLPPGGNNGLAIRYPGEGDAAYVGMCELQVLDNTAPQYQSLKEWQYHGSAYGMVPAQREYQRPVGEWNFEEVTVVGSRVKVELNGFVILDADLADVKEPASGQAHEGRTRTRGHFGFAGHNDPVMFRNVRIKRLD